MKSYRSYDDGTLVQLLVKGDEDAFKQIFETYRDRLFIFIKDIIHSEQVAEELVLDVFMKIWLGRELLGEVENLQAFLYRVARNKAIDFFRVAAKDEKFKTELLKQFGDSSLHQESADHALVVKEYESSLREAVSLLSPQRKEAWRLSREENMTHDEIAAKMQISPRTVNYHISEAKDFIRRHLAKNLDIALVLILFGDHS